MQGLEKIGFAQDDEGYYTTHLVSDDDVLRLAVSIFGRHFHRSATINHAQDAAVLLRHRLALREHEVFVIIWLDQRHRFI